jgi:hypothetical protein
LNLKEVRDAAAAVLLFLEENRSSSQAAAREICAELSRMTVTTRHVQPSVAELLARRCQQTRSNRDGTVAVCMCTKNTARNTVENIYKILSDILLEVRSYTDLMYMDVVYSEVHAYTCIY